MQLNIVNRFKFIASAGFGLVLVFLAVLAIQGAWAQSPAAESIKPNPPVFPPDKPPLPGSLKELPVPLPDNLADFVLDKQAAIVLGKAFFWDEQAGTDGIACASCHFHAGADSRTKNQLNPGVLNQSGAPVSNAFNLTASNRLRKGGPPPGGGPNYSLKKDDFPFHQLANPGDRESGVIFDSDDVVSSQGAFPRNLVSLLPEPQRGDQCGAQPSMFNVKGINVRQTPGRNSPTVINAIFNFRNFWDGRANNVFNGRNPFGLRDTTAGVDPSNSVMVADGLGNLSAFKVVIQDASLASQAVGPPLSPVEMSCSNRAFEQIGQKLLRRQPLAGQHVDPTDSVLGLYAVTTAGPGPDATGLTISYDALIKKAFLPKFWNSTRFTVEGYTLMEKNFSLFWGLSIMLYESTLVSDDAPFDRYMEGDITAMTRQQIEGFLQVFMNKGGCNFCHRGPEFTNAGTTLKLGENQGEFVERMAMGDGKVALYDSGFYNIGVRPTGEDIGTGGKDPFGNPLSWSRMAKKAATQVGGASSVVDLALDKMLILTCNFQINPCSPVAPDERDAVDGSFKTPTLRNIDLTGPYFHNGGTATLEQVVEFYDRGGDHRGPDSANTTGFGANSTNLAPSMAQLGLSDSEAASLVAFMKALTDERVRWERAPFDHPELHVPNGHQIDENRVVPKGRSFQAVDDMILIPAVGAAGRAAKGIPPLMSFDAGLP